MVFASEKDHRIPGTRLHTNFRLSAEGEYLALVKHNGAAIASEFRPAFPPQVLDVTYGFDQFGNTPLLTAATNGVYFTRPTPGTANVGGTGMSGEELARAIKAKDPLQMLTGYGEVLDQLTQEGPLVNFTLSKPIDMPFLRLMLLRLISQEAV